MLAAILLAALLQEAAAAECVPAETSIGLRGRIEYRFEQPTRTGPFMIVLNLEQPICVTGLGPTRGKAESFMLFQLGIPAKLNKELRDGDHVFLRGSVGRPAVNDPKQRIIFAVREVL